MRIINFRGDLINILAKTNSPALSNAKRWQSAHQRLFLESWSVVTPCPQSFEQLPSNTRSPKGSVASVVVISFMFPYVIYRNREQWFRFQTSIKHLSMRYCDPKKIVLTMLNINICRGDLPYILAETKIQIGNMLLIISAQVCVSVFISVDVSVWTPWKLFILIFKNYIFTGSNLSQNYVLIIMRTKLRGLRSRPSLCNMIHINISPSKMIIHTYIYTYTTHHGTHLEQGLRTEQARQ